MRDIKFRAWDFDLEEMCEVYGLDKYYARYISKPNTDKDSMYETTLDNLAIMQYTGLKDKNGVEIYESDIISVCFNKEDYPNENVLVEWDKDSWIVKHLRNDIKQIYSLSTVIHECKVIGNIYENPELLS